MRERKKVSAESRKGPDRVQDNLSIRIVLHTGIYRAVTFEFPLLQPRLGQGAPFKLAQYVREGYPHNGVWMLAKRLSLEDAWPACLVFWLI